MRLHSPDTSGKRAVVIASTFPPPVGGISVQSEKLAVLLSEEGVPVFRLRSNPPAPWFLRFVAPIKGLRTLVRTAQYLAAMFRILPKINVVHILAQSGPGFFMNTAPLLILAPMAKKRTILNFRSGNAGSFLRQWSGLAVPLMRRADVIATPSPFLQRIFRAYGLDASLLPNIADTELFPFHPRQRFAPRMIVARNLKTLYAVDDILRAFRVVQWKHPEAALGIVGEGPEEHRLRKLASELDLKHVTFYGRIENRAMPNLYDQYDIAVNASIVDNFPGAILEAALSGLAIVSTRSGGIPEMIRDGETGLLVEPHDHHALACAILEVLEHFREAFARTLRARNWAEQFSWPHVYKQLLQCYGFQNLQSVQESSVAAKTVA